VTGVAVAGPGEDAARAHTKTATAAFNVGSYAEAAAEYERAYRLVPDPVLLFNIGQAHRLGGNAEKAIVAYKSYLRTAPADAPNREQVEKRIEDLEAISWTPGAAPKPAAAGKPAKDLTPKPEPPGPPAVDLSASATPQSEVTTSAPVYRRWWFWTSVGAVVLAGTTTAIILSRGHEGPIKGNVDPPVVVVR
jgi:tetratricopeptide (TPR) repeat protein